MLCSLDTLWQGNRKIVKIIAKNGYSLSGLIIFILSFQPLK
jgi:hypothetical protein